MKARRTDARCIRSQSCLIATGTLVEMHTVLGRSLSAEQIQAILDRLQVTVTPTDAMEANVAAHAYHRYGRGSGHPARLNVGDTLSYAAAKTRGLPLVFKGKEFPHTDVARLGSLSRWIAARRTSESWISDLRQPAHRS